MELIIFSVRIVYWIFVAPIWWLASGLAAFVYPFEGDSKHTALAMLIAGLMIASGIFAFIYFIGI
jgi:hypothetical protein